MDRPLPNLHQALLDAETLNQLEMDLTHLAKILEMKTRGGASRDAKPVGSLPEALATLRTGEAKGLQIRYLFADAHWLDTFMRGPDGIRLTRIQLDPAP